MWNRVWGLGDTKYQPNNDAHKELISDQIKKTRQTFEALAKVDLTIGTALSLETYLTLNGWAGGWGAYAILPVYYATAKGIASAMDRAGKVEAFASARNALFKTYHWCMENGLDATRDPLVLRVLKTLQPFMQSRGALIPEGMQSQMNELPLDFQRVIMACPEDGRRIWPHTPDQTLTQAMDEIFSDITAIQVATYIEKRVDTDWTRFFSQAAANALRLGYGSEMKQEDVQAPKNN